MAKKKPAKVDKKKESSAKVDLTDTSAPAALTPMQQLFIKEYLICKNGTQAALKAGYSEDCAGQQAYENLKKPEIKKAIERETTARYKRLDLTADRILHELMLIATVDIGEAYDEEGNLLPIKDIPEHVRRAIAGVEVEEVWDGYGNERTQSGELKKLKLVDKKGALETLAKNLKLLTDKLEIKDTTGLANRLAAARKRKAK